MKPTLKQIANLIGVHDRTLKNWEKSKPNLYRIIMRCFGTPEDCTHEICSGKTPGELMELKRQHYAAIEKHRDEIERIDTMLLAATGADTDIIKERVRQTIKCAEEVLSDENGGRFIFADELDALYKSGYFDTAKMMIVDAAAMRRAAKNAGNRKWVYGIDDCMQFRVGETIYWAPRPCE